MSLNERVALVTGGARGIGLAIARRLVADGARVALVDLDKSAVEEAAAGLGASATSLVADVTRADEVERAVGAAHARWGRLDIVVNNAGITGGSKLTWELTDEDWHQVIACDLTSVFLVSRAAVRLMLPARSGRIVNIASIAGKEGNPTLVPYSTAKAGVIGLHQGAREGSRDARDSRQRRGARRHRDGPGQADVEGDRRLPGRQDPDGACGSSGGGRRARRLARLRRVLVLDGRGLRPFGRPRYVLKQGHLRDRLRDLALDGHADRLVEWHDLPLEELVVVGGQGIGRQPVARRSNTRSRPDRRSTGRSASEARAARPDSHPSSRSSRWAALAGSSPGWAPPPGSSHEIARSKMTELADQHNTPSARRTGARRPSRPTARTG